MTKQIRDFIRKYDTLSHELSGTIDEVIERLQALKSTHQNPGSILVLEWETEYGSYGDSDRQHVQMYDRRQETDEEYESRLLEEQKIKAEVLQHKRKQFEALKKELGE